MTLSMTIISAQETSQETQEESILEEDIQTEIDEAATEEVAADEATTDEAATDEAATEVAADENSEDSKDGVLESEEVPESEEVSITEEVPAFVGVEELSEAYQVELDAATQEGYMPIDILIQTWIFEDGCRCIYLYGYDICFAKTCSRSFWFDRYYVG